MPIANLLAQVLNIINTYIIPLLVAAAIVALFWGIVKYIWSAGDVAGKQDGVKIITAGIIGLVVMLGIWGIVSLVSTSIGVGGSQTVVLPRVQ